MAAPRPQGNTRTGQDKEFTKTDTVHRTREQFDRHEASAEAKNLATVAPDAAGMDITDRAQRMGKTLTSQQMIYRLQKINPNFVFLVSTGDDTKYGIYLPGYGPNKFGIIQHGLQHICGMENTGHPLTGGLMPEFSIIDTVKETVPGENGDRVREEFRAETRGWRTVLAILLSKYIITVGDVERYWGIVPSKESARWMELAMTPIELMTYRGIQNEREIDPIGGLSDPRDRGRADGPEDGDQSQLRADAGVDDGGDYGGESAGYRDAAEGRRGETAPRRSDGEHAQGSEPERLGRVAEPEPLLTS